jgi:hypothetical protein
MYNIFEPEKYRNIPVLNQKAGWSTNFTSEISENNLAK